MAVDSLYKQRQGPRGRPFQKGQSGNLAGRPPGSRNHTTLVAEALLQGEAQALTRKAIELALEGDTTALRLCLERIVPQRKSRAVSFEAPRVDRVEDLAGAIGSIFQEVAGGRLRLDEGAALVGMLESKRRAMETIDLEKRLRALEAQHKVRPMAPRQGRDGTGRGSGRFVRVVRAEAAA
jgi:Family of unknown function (DUF5681)